MTYTIEKIASIVKGRIEGKGDPSLVITELLFDSRLLTSPGNTLFFSLKSNRNNGNKYIDELYNKGVRCFVVEESLSSLYPLSYFIVVEDTLKALQELAAHHRKNFCLPVVGITGSNGKTIIKEWLYQILSPEMPVARSPKSYNSQIGVPMSVWQLNELHQAAIFEAGISRPGEMQNLEKIIRPTIGIFTNIGEAHGKNFDNIRHKVEEKLKLFLKVDTLIYCSDHKEIKEAVEKKNINTFSWSRKDNKADVQIYSIEKGEGETIISAVRRNSQTQNDSQISGFSDSQIQKIRIPFTDDASIENAIHCWLAAMRLGIPDNVIETKMQQLCPIEMRMELKSGINNCEVINDSYNSDFNSLTIALDFMNQHHHSKEKVVILSDILQSELKEEDLYENIAHLLRNKGVTSLIGIGEAMSRQQNKFDINKIFYKDTKDFLTNHKIEDFHNQMILLKGARDFSFEKISRLLEEKAHESILEINLDSLVKNMNYYRSKLKSGTKLMVMVKAFAYGSGNFEVSNVVEFHRADYLTVAYADEGIELRRKGISLPIMVMTPEANTFESIIKNNLEPDIYSFRSLTLLEDAIKKLEKPLKSPIGIHIKLDTGMHRLGFLKDDIDELLTRLKKNSNIIVKSVFSHLAGSDSEKFNDFTSLQINNFEEMSSKIIEAFPYKILRHILNSAGISRFTDYQYDMVRLGIGIYGVPPCDEDRGKLKNVVSLKTTIVQIKEYECGETVGYSRRGVINRKSKIGVVPIGYADGLKRQLGNGNACFYVNGKAAPIIGNICMDMCMIDLTDIECKENDTAILFDENHSIERIAEACDTIAYEILTSISQRVKRIYYHE
ncbi:MAG: bifunctional UDP-N-acetylmuramoyl-tripeptide:D-alanyl-D-alanine ligase/alanine racemase [Lentimicrobiaceae bacterium]|nr:bifunctional UDP-N-acetylmuramoyl-tripeptide:D-alanyl-D-alanine ligase/alanine racemase [Lentimicrobiaceae bacterium]